MNLFSIFKGRRPQYLESEKMEEIMTAVLDELRVEVQKVVETIVDLKLKASEVREVQVEVLKEVQIPVNTDEELQPLVDALKKANEVAPKAQVADAPAIDNGQ